MKCRSFHTAVFIISVLCIANSASASGPADDSAPANSYYIGVEGFHDYYREPSPDVTTTTNYGSLTGNYTSYFNSEYFAAVDARVSYGEDQYSSPSGQLSGVPQWEAELRGRIGMVWWQDGEGDNASAYVGVGGRYFLDEGKGYVTNTGAIAYDRRIAQAYVPIGLSYTQAFANGWTLVPTVEYDAILAGNVNSRLTNAGYPNENNSQYSGYGLRAEVMLGDKINKTFSWQAGPFIRYWNINESKLNITPLGHDLALFTYEPSNTRTQAGMTLRVLW